LTHLDTSFLIDLLRERDRAEEGAATAKLDSVAEERLVVSQFVACELHAGAAGSVNPDREHRRVEALLRAFGGADVVEAFPMAYGRLLAELRRRGETIGTMDLLIATAALVDGGDLLTRNVRDFEKVPGLTVVAY